MTVVLRIMAFVMTLIMMTPSIISLIYDSNEVVETISAFSELLICFPLLIVFVYAADEVEYLD